MTEIVYRDMTAAQCEAQYNLSISSAGYESTVIPDWAARSVAARGRMDAALDTRYGAGEKQKLDVYSCGDAGAPVLVYIHGGYWQRGAKSLYGFLAEAFVRQGVNVVVVGYDLCPSVTVTQISAQIREALSWVWREAAEIGVSRDRLVLMGHSAGGHLTEMMMGTDWSVYADDLPREMLRAGIPISPLTELEPLRFTTLNDLLKMDAAEAERESPLHNHPPVTDAPQLVACGGGETGEFLRQAQLYVDAFRSDAREIEFYVVPDVDHFEEINVLADEDSPFFGKVMKLLRES